MNLYLSVQQLTLGRRLLRKVATVTTRCDEVSQFCFKVTQLFSTAGLCQHALFQKPVDALARLIEFFTHGFSRSLTKLCLTNRSTRATKSFPCTHERALRHTTKQRTFCADLEFVAQPRQCFLSTAQAYQIAGLGRTHVHPIANRGHAVCSHGCICHTCGSKFFSGQSKTLRLGHGGLSQAFGSTGSLCTFGNKARGPKTGDHELSYDLRTFAKKPFGVQAQRIPC